MEYYNCKKYLDMIYIFQTKMSNEFDDDERRDDDFDDDLIKYEILCCFQTFDLFFIFAKFFFRFR